MLVEVLSIQARSDAFSIEHCGFPWSLYLMTAGKISKQLLCNNAMFISVFTWKLSHFCVVYIFSVTLIAFLFITWWPLLWVDPVYFTAPSNHLSCKHRSASHMLCVSSRAAGAEDSDGPVAFSRPDQEGGRDVDTGQISHQPLWSFSFTDPDSCHIKSN